MTPVYRSDSVRGKVHARGTIAVATALGGCLAQPPEAMLPGERAQGVLRDVQALEYRTWAGPPRGEDEAVRARAAGPHGAFIEVFLDPTLAGAQDSDTTLTLWPVGSTAVAEGYDDESAGEPSLISIVTKRDDGWLWAQVAEDGAELAYGRPDDCLSCHFGGMDLIFSIDLPEVDE